MKKLTNSDMIGKVGISLVGLRLAEIGFLFHEAGAVEAGTDGFVELRDPSSGQMLSTVFRLQSKATRNGRAWKRETEASFEYPCKERDIADWVGSNVPVVLVGSDVARQVAFWKDVTAYFRSAERRADRHVVFDKRIDVFDQSAAVALAAVAVSRTAGLNIPPPARAEELLSNLLPEIDHPRSLWVAPALVSEMWEVEEVLRDAGIGVECFVRAGRLYSFRPLEELEWQELCDTAGAERFGASEWAESEDPVRQHEFAELLRPRWGVAPSRARGVRSGTAERQPRRGRTPTRAGATAPGPARSAAPGRSPTLPAGAARGAILEALASGQAMTATQVAAATGLGRGTVSTTLSRLTRAGEITKARRGYQLGRERVTADETMADSSEAERSAIPRAGPEESSS